jgi:HEAT repeat protein
MELLIDPSFEAREALTSAIVASGGEMAVPELIRIGRDAEGRYPQQVRLHALRTLGALQLDYCLGFLLEHLRVFPLHEARRFASTLAEQDGSLFDSHVERLLTTTDAGVRAGVISVLPATERKSFAKQIKAALDDADAEVRVAAAWALAEFGDNTSLNAAADRLRDPVESVRRETARALGFAGTKKLLDQLRELIEDEQEVDAVRLAAIEGLAASPAPESVDILVDALDAYPHYADAINGALAEKTGRKTLGQLVERFKDAEPKLRDNLKDAFTRMGGDGEQTMLEILREEIASLAPVVSEVLEETGRVESLIRQLRHRDATARRDAAATLALIGTPQAFRGIVQAARDPEQDVRVQVSRALERLNSEDGQDILQQLQQDPDRRVRKYTQWALHRIETKSA